MSYASNSAELNADFENIMDKAVNYVIDKILEEYKKDIDAIIYGAGTPMVYQRTYEFKDSWRAEVKNVTRGAKGNIHQDYNVMTYNPSLRQHGTNKEDLREKLATMLFEGVGNKDTWYNQPRDAWTPLIEMLDGGKIDQWFQEAMRLQGLKVSKM